MDEPTTEEIIKHLYRLAQERPESVKWQAADRLTQLAAENERLNMALVFEEAKEQHITSLQSTLDEVEKHVQGEMFTGHLEGGEGCEDNTCGYGCSYCETNKNLGKALALIRKEK